MAALEAHFDQASHEGVHPQPRDQDPQHHQGAHQVLAKAEGEAQQQLGAGWPPQFPGAGEGFAQQHGGEHQGHQHRR